MPKSLETSQLLLNVNSLRGQASKTAYQGVLVALASIVVATLLVSFYTTGEISVTSIIKVQQENFSLWVLDALPFIFGFWGQYSSSIIAGQSLVQSIR